MAKSSGRKFFRRLRKVGFMDFRFARLFMILATPAQFLKYLDSMDSFFSQKIHAQKYINSDIKNCK